MPGITVEIEKVPVHKKRGLFLINNVNFRTQKLTSGTQAKVTRVAALYPKTQDESCVTPLPCPQNVLHPIPL